MKAGRNDTCPCGSGVTIRLMLDGKGLMDAANFDELVASGGPSSLRHNGATALDSNWPCLGNVIWGRSAFSRYLSFRALSLRLSSRRIGAAGFVG